MARQSSRLLLSLESVIEDEECIWQVVSEPHVCEPHPKASPPSSLRSVSDHTLRWLRKSTGPIYKYRVGRRKANMVNKLLLKARYWLWKISLLMLTIEMMILGLLLVSRSIYYRDIMEEEALRGMAVDDISMVLLEKEHSSPANAIVDFCWKMLTRRKESS